MHSGIHLYKIYKHNILRYLPCESQKTTRHPHINTNTWRQSWPLHLHPCEMAHYQQTNQLASLSERPLVKMRDSHYTTLSLADSYTTLSLADSYTTLSLADSSTLLLTDRNPSCTSDMAESFRVKTRIHRSSVFGWLSVECCTERSSHFMFGDCCYHTRAVWAV